MSIGFSTCINENIIYHKLCEVLVDSVLLFTDLPIEVVSFNSDFKFKSKRVINRRIDIPLKTKNQIWYSKFLASSTTLFDKAIFLDADNVVTPEIHNVYSWCDESDDFPVYSPHPSNPWPIAYKQIEQLKLPQPFQRWMAGALFCYTQKAVPFLRECWTTGLKWESEGIEPYGDDGVLNLLLLKYNKKIPEKNIILPLPHWAMQMLFYNIPPPDDLLKCYSVHGCKTPKEAREMLNNLSGLYLK